MGEGFPFFINVNILGNSILGPTLDSNELPVMNRLFEVLRRSNMLCSGA